MTEAFYNYKGGNDEINGKYVDLGNNFRIDSFRIENNNLLIEFIFDSYFEDATKIYSKVIFKFLNGKILKLLTDSFGGNSLRLSGLSFNPSYKENDDFVNKNNTWVTVKIQEKDVYFNSNIYEQMKRANNKMFFNLYTKNGIEIDFVATGFECFVEE